MQDERADTSVTARFNSDRPYVVASRASHGVQPRLPGNQRNGGWSPGVAVVVQDQRPGGMARVLGLAYRPDIAGTDGGHAIQRSGDLGSDLPPAPVGVVGHQSKIAGPRGERGRADRPVLMWTDRADAAEYSATSAGHGRPPCAVPADG